MNNAILPIDPGKYKSVVCLYDKISNQAGFETITNKSTQQAISAA